MKKLTTLYLKNVGKIYLTSRIFQNSLRPGHCKYVTTRYLKMTCNVICVFFTGVIVLHDTQLLRIGFPGHRRVALRIAGNRIPGNE